MQKCPLSFSPSISRESDDDCGGDPISIVVMTFHNFRTTTIFVRVSASWITRNISSSPLLTRLLSQLIGQQENAHNMLRFYIHFAFILSTRRNSLHSQFKDSTTLHYFITVLVRFSYSPSTFTTRSIQSPSAILTGEGARGHIVDMYVHSVVVVCTVNLTLWMGRRLLGGSVFW